MYAIISVGGKQAKVREGDLLSVERIKDTGTVSYTPLLVVSGNGDVTSEPGALKKVSVTAEVVGESKGPKIDIFKYKAKTGYRRRQGHRQKYTTIKVTAINIPKSKAASSEAASTKAASTKAASSEAASTKAASTKAASSEAASPEKKVEKKAETSAKIVPETEAKEA